jgi:hypothetical protein
MFSGMFLLCWIGFFILMIASVWTVYTKAHQPGWASIIQIYNLIVMLRITGRPLWWILLMLVPLVNIAIAIIMVVDLAKSFGKTGAYAIGLILLPLIFYPMLAFGSSSYQGARAA